MLNVVKFDEESFSTLVAVKLVMSCVELHVSLQITLLVEMLITYTADNAFSVFPLVAFNPSTPLLRFLFTNCLK